MSVINSSKAGGGPVIGFASGPRRILTSSDAQPFGKVVNNELRQPQGATIAFNSLTSSSLVSVMVHDPDADPPTTPRTAAASAASFTQLRAARIGFRLPPILPARSSAAARRCTRLHGAYRRGPGRDRDIGNRACHRQRHLCGDRQAPAQDAGRRRCVEAVGVTEAIMKRNWLRPWRLK